MEIRFKGGQPLLIGGQVAGSQSCCCENPPPPACYCPDLCSYFFEVTSPPAVAVKSSPVDCLSSGGFPFVSLNEWLFPGVTYLPGWSICENPYAPPYYRSQTDNSGVTAVLFYGVFCNPDNEYDYVEVSGRAVIILGCYGGSGGFTGTPAVSVYWRVVAERRLVPIGGDYYLTHSLAFAQAGGMVYPSTFCQYNDKRSCGPPAGISMPPNGFKYINTPLTLELSRSSVSVNGSTQSLDPEDFISFANPGYDASSTIAFVNEISDAFTTTFRITSRPSCKTVPADCDVPIGEGNVRVFWGGATPEFVLGTPELMSVTDPVTNDLLYYEHQGGIGTIVNPYKFFFYRTDNPNTQTLEQQYLDLYCESDNNVSPPVTAWYVVHETFKYCGGFTWDKWAGTIDMYGAPEDCGNISAGDPVPIGEPIMERIGGYPLLSSGGCGDPAPRIRFELEAPCGG